MAIEAVKDVLFVFGARLDSEPDLSGDMLGVNERAEGNGGGFKSAKAIKGGEGAGKKEEEEEEEKDKEWKPADEAKRVPYTKNKWFLVAEWHDVDMEEALRRAAEIMIEDFKEPYQFFPKNIPFASEYSEFFRIFLLPNDISECNFSECCSEL